ncbi:MAG: histidine--tRNA ligase [Candidatus Nealsonbacteria bacterium RBG_13_37_56]|uniref:Histidine--tRNA ligase n=1 Tax=Candidatus Nealsonbacteria bacterium RBG_13_37_56 TaxID=1801661 RepID=A0A1G2DXE7_9BACT|nr:MAG: histidine--tRNA ligase [Candidatus Nealsonbacteria bacterium RBG_13_37_56]
MSKNPKFQSPTGMRDILPEDQKYFKKIYDTVFEIADFYGFGKIDTPILEETELFSRGIGLTTDVVSKEMYTLKTKGGDNLSLRPEWTAPIARSYIENGMYALPQPIKLWYFGPCYRHERPQADRYRQFWQFGFEVLGEKNPVIDAQIIQIFYNILKELKLKNLIVEINSIGDSNCRPYYKKLLSNYYKSRENSLCADCKRRAKDNILRLLDCKEEKCQPIKTEAPEIIDHLCEECHSHFKEVLEFLDEIELPYNLNPHLVRGLDYYTKTVFEIFFESESEKKEEVVRNALVGGGRYDKLVKLLGGRDTPASGAAAGVERIIKLMKAQGVSLGKEAETQIFLAQLGSLAKRKSLRLLEDFRKSKIKLEESFGKDSLKSQLNRADKVGAKYTLILGQKEALDGVVIIRDMSSGNQEIVKIDQAVAKVKNKLKK